LNAPLTIPDPASTPAAQPVLVKVHPAAGVFEIVSHTTKAEVQHVQGEMLQLSKMAATASLQQPDGSITSSKGRGVKLGPASAEAARARCTHPQDSAHLYSTLRAIGLEYGPAFRLLESIHASDLVAATAAAAAAAGPAQAGSATASITPNGTGNWGGCNFVTHPAALVRVEFVVHVLL
jgi:acyl transferase domain-containing protein